MGRPRSRAFTGEFGIWETPPTGDPMAPFLEPAQHLSRVRFHSRLQYLAKLLEQPAVTINHTALAGVTGTGITGAPTSGGASSGSSDPIGNGQIRVTDFTLYEHGLGYPPLYMAMYGTEILSGATLVQEENPGRRRIVSSYATSTIIGLREVAFSSSSALSAASRDYRVLVFRNPASDPAKATLKVSATELYFGQGKIGSGDAMLRGAVPGDSQTFFLPSSETVDNWNGGLRAVAQDRRAVDVAGDYTGPLFTVAHIEVAYE